MKRWLPLALIVAAGLAAIVLVQRQHVSTRPSTGAVLLAAADAEHELTRVPSRMDRMSDTDEIAAGDELARSYESRWPLRAASDRATQTYLQEVGERVAAHARRKLPYRFHYIPDGGFVNAFALPGGHVFVGQGLLKLVHSEDALAAVLGHEVEHIDLRHCIERTQTEAHLRHLGVLGALAGIPVEIFMVGYSKEQELEADRDGTALAVAAGYSPNGILQLFDNFGKLEEKLNAVRDRQPRSPVEEAAQLSLQTLTGYFRSHPPSAEREEQVRRLIRAQRWPTPPLRPVRISI